MSQRLLFSALFFSVFLLFFCCTICEATGGTTAAAPQSVKIFPSTKPTVTGANGSSEITFMKFYSPSLVATDNALVAVAGGLRESDVSFKASENSDILTKYIETEENGWLKSFMNENNWKTEYAPKRIVMGNRKGKLIAATTNENKIYILVVNNSVTSEELKTNLKKWEFVFVEGKVKREERTYPKITWKITSLTDLFKNSSFKEGILNNPQFISAFVTTKGKVVFFVKQEIQNNKNIFGVIQIKGSAATFEELPFEDVNENCNPHFILLGEKVIMIPINCYKNLKIQKFDYTDDKLKKRNESVGQVWEFLKNKKDIITAKINNTSVVLFIQEKNNQDKKDIYLWITDGSRLANVGIVFSGVKDGFYRSFVCTKDHLFFLHKKTDETSSHFNITYFLKQMEDITFLLSSWKQGNEKVTQLCQKPNSIKTSCSTDGLVAFLSNKNKNVNLWEDEYVYVNATVKEGTKVEDGFLFDKRGAGALWAVGEGDKNQQLYNFAASGFTLVATVTVGGGTRGGDNSLLGVKNGDSTQSVGVWCLSEGVFAVSVNEKKELSTFSNKTCVVKSEYEVALVYSGGKELFVYVDWGRLGDKQAFEISTNPANKLQFYFGADGSQQTSVTVTNVLLYNRPFNTSEIEQLKPKQINVADTTRQLNDSFEPNDNTTKAESHQNTSKSTSPNKRKDGAKIKFCLFSINSVTVVSFFLCLYFGGVMCDAIINL